MRDRAPPFARRDDTFRPDDVLRTYGSDAIAVAALAAAEPELAQLLHPRLPYIAAEVVYAARKEMARTIDDVLARRTRALFLDAAASEEAAPLVARLLGRELGRPPEWETEQLSSFTPIGEIGRIAARV